MSKDITAENFGVEPRPDRDAVDVWLDIGDDTGRLNATECKRLAEQLLAAAEYVENRERPLAPAPLDFTKHFSSSFGDRMFAECVRNVETGHDYVSLAGFEFNLQRMVELRNWLNQAIEYYTDAEKYPKVPSWRLRLKKSPSKAED